MEVLKLTSTIDSSGQLRLDIPTALSSDNVDIVLILNPVVSKDESTPIYDFSDLVGRLKWQGDAVAIQKALRDEW